ncbi:type I-C CRISPR-associated protein Cas8c/Csd1 [Bacteroides oleiciplenus]|uniref:Type I-C CRISPR-associated protein Cas8c/Csd1 n=1 Tax=Bacteroides oleiciplenus TaxID=626931 RepID=A0A3E5B9J1_9BACE|nr:type I-C CRISPR-associated protein Cas8c/Csd1 [Bacteroides oleiciplenus]RGN34270.1 type I-C CRISPR-associated protein Cas8c/Csd1 [Bacteroides oleiciplenus]
MILKALYDYYQRKGNLAPIGFQEVEIHYVIIISPEGDFVKIENRKKLSQVVIRAATNKSGTGAIPNILWDKADYMINLDSDKQDIGNGITEKCKSEVFIVKELILFYPHRKDFAALGKFYEKKQYYKIRESDYWDEIKTNKHQISFQLLGELNLVASYSDDLVDYLKRKWQSLPRRICLVTGQKGHIVKTTAITSLLEATNGKLVSFQKKSGYDSYRKEQGDNAPISIETECAFSTALNHLLGRKSRNKLILGDKRVIVFWSSARESFKADEYEEMLAAFFNFSDKKSDNPDSGIELIRASFNNIYKGKNVIDSTDYFYFLGLSPNGKARISVVYWNESPLRVFYEAVLNHLKDMEIIDNRYRKKPYIGIYDIINAVSCKAKSPKSKKTEYRYQPNLIEMVFRSIIQGTIYPQPLFISCLQRIRAEQNVPKRGFPEFYEFIDLEITRIAILKAYLNRLDNDNKKLEIMIDKENTNQGYLCGRLFAVLEKIQENKIKKETEKNDNGNTIRSRYMNAASATPIAVFPTILNLSVHHAEKLDKGVQIWFEQIKSEIVDKIMAEGFPCHLSLPDQGRFFVGYYHQRQCFFTKKDNAINELENNVE